MSETGLDYSAFPYKIRELEQMNWDSLHFNLRFDKPQSKEQKRLYKKLMNEWFNKDTYIENSDENPHYLSDFTWDKEAKKFSFWIDMGNSDLPALQKLLSKFSAYQNIIEELTIGETPIKRDIPKDKILKPVKQMSVDPTKYPFRIFEKRWHDSTPFTPFTINFTRELNETEKSAIEDVIYNYFSQGKKDDEIAYFLGVKWVNAQTVGWWTEDFPLNSTTLDTLLSKFIPYKDIIKEVIIGVYLDYEFLKKYL